MSTRFGPRVTALVAAWLGLGLGLVQADERLLGAASVPDRAAVLELLASGADPNATAADGATALHWAVYHDEVELVLALIEAGADVNAGNDYGATPMSEAAVVGNAVVIDALLRAGADVESPNAEGQTALMVLARSANVDAARVLLEHGADANATEAWRGQTALMWAAAQNQPEMVALLLEHGADPERRSKINHWPRQVSAEHRRMYRPTGGLTALLLAAREGCRGCVEALAAAGADVDRADPDGVTALLLATDNLHFDTSRALLEAGADPNRIDWWGRTALYAAVDMNTLPRGGFPDRPSTDDTSGMELIGLLLAAGANPNAQLKLTPPFRSIGDDRGCDLMLSTGATPLLRAAKAFDLPAMEQLLKHGARVNLPNDTGITPLMAAAGFGSVECDTRGPSPGIPQYFDSDVQERSIAALDLLLDAGADVHARTQETRGRVTDRGQTALYGAAFWGWNDVVEHLVAHGARIDAVDPEGRTPVDAALGRAGGHGRGDRIEVFEDTARLLVELCDRQDGCQLPERAAAAH